MSVLVTCDQCSYWPFCFSYNYFASLLLCSILTVNLGFRDNDVSLRSFNFFILLSGPCTCRVGRVHALTRANYLASSSVSAAAANLLHQWFFVDKILLASSGLPFLYSFSISWGKWLCYELFWLLAVYRDFQLVMLMVSELCAGIEEVAQGWCHIQSKD